MTTKLAKTKLLYGYDFNLNIFEIHVSLQIALSKNRLLDPTLHQKQAVRSHASLAPNTSYT